MGTDARRVPARYQAIYAPAPRHNLTGRHWLAGWDWPVIGILTANFAVDAAILWVLL